MTAPNPDPLTPPLTWTYDGTVLYQDIEVWPHQLNDAAHYSRGERVGFAQGHRHGIHQGIVIGLIVALAVVVAVGWVR